VKVAQPVRCEIDGLDGNRRLDVLALIAHARVSGR
jgi:hypothetical protein